jgi:N6-adenosine-specific RNA methylase IME4
LMGELHPYWNLPAGGYGAILADPPWAFPRWAGPAIPARQENQPYKSMLCAEIGKLPVADLAAEDCVAFVWVTWPMLLECVEAIQQWGFTYKTCAFAWLKGNNTQPDFFTEEIPAQVGMGYWTRANSEVCLLATRGKPKRLNADVRQGIIAPRREHSRKPDGIHERIERLVAGPYVELFARQKRAGWDVWGNQTDKFGEAA